MLGSNLIRDIKGALGLYPADSKWVQLTSYDDMELQLWGAVSDLT